MDDKLKTKFIAIPIKIMAGLVASMILLRFVYVFNDGKNVWDDEGYAGRQYENDVRDDGGYV